MNTMIEMYDRIMSVVEEVTGISKDKILTSNCEECVDARHILVYILGRGLFPASFTHSLWRIWHYGLSFFLMFLTTITPKVMGKYIKPRTIQQVPPKVINCPNCGK